MLATQVSQLSSRIDRELTRTLREFVRMRTVSCDPRLRDDCFKGAMYLAHMLEALGAEIKISRCGCGRSRLGPVLHGYNFLPCGEGVGFESASCWTCSGMGLSGQILNKSHRDCHSSCMRAQTTSCLSYNSCRSCLGYVWPHQQCLIHLVAVSRMTIILAVQASGGQEPHCDWAPGA